MGAERRNVPADTQDSPDPEATAELPVLEPLRAPPGPGPAPPELSATDTWVVDGALAALASRSRELERQLALETERARGLEGEIETLRTARTAAEDRAESSGRELAATLLALEASRAEIKELERRLQALESEVHAAVARAAEGAERLAERETSLERLETRLREKEREGEARLEALGSLEGRRGTFAAIVHRIEDELLQAEARASELEREMGRLRHAFEAKSAQREPPARDSSIDALKHRAEALEHELARALSQLAERASALAEVESDLRAAEDMVNQLESDVRGQSVRIEELTQINDDWRSMLEAARQELEQRDASIRKLASDAEQGTALLERIELVGEDLEAAASELSEPRAESMQRVLILAEGDGEVVHVLGRTTSIGRTPDNDLQLDTKFVSRHHAMILTGPVDTIVEDLRSTNGVIVNGRRVSRQCLKDGDAIVIGKTKFRFAVRPAEERRSAS